MTTRREAMEEALGKLMKQAAMREKGRHEGMMTNRRVMSSPEALDRDAKILSEALQKGPLRSKDACDLLDCDTKRLRGVVNRLRSKGVMVAVDMDGRKYTYRLGQGPKPSGSQRKMVEFLSEGPKTTEHLVQEFGSRQTALTIIGALRKKGYNIETSQLANHLFEYRLGESEWHI